MKDFRLDNIVSYSSTVRAAQRVLKETKKLYPKDIDMYKLRTGKTLYFFTTKQKMENKLKELDIDKFETAYPGQNLTL